MNSRRKFKIVPNALRLTYFVGLTTGSNFAVSHYPLSSDYVSAALERFYTYAAGIGLNCSTQFSGIGQWEGKLEDSLCLIFIVEYTQENCDRAQLLKDWLKTAFLQDCVALTIDETTAFF